MLGLCPPCMMCVFDVSMGFVILINTHHPTRLDNPTSYCLRKCSKKWANILVIHDARDLSVRGEKVGDKCVN